MYRSPTFLFLYLPWLFGVASILVLLADPFNKTTSDNHLYLASPDRLCTPAHPPIKIISAAPRFPGCGDLPEGDQCAAERLKDYVYSRVTFPATPEKEYDAGLVVISFVVRPSGRIEEITLMREPGYGRGADALRIIRGMIEEDIRWEPATVNGKAVAQRTYLKIWYRNFRWTN